MPLETNGGSCAGIRQPWYPVEEQYGLVWLYMGPPDAMPLVPRYACMEPLGDGEYYSHRFDSLPGAVSHVLPTSWLIDQDNISLARVKADGLDMSINPMADWDRTDPEVVQRQPSDNEAQNSQGPIAWHSNEHLVRSDRGVGKLRRQYSRELKALAEGQPLMAIRMPGEDPFLPVRAGAHVIVAAPAGAALPPADPEAPAIDAGGT